MYRGCIGPASNGKTSDVRANEVAARPSFFFVYPNVSPAFFVRLRPMPISPPRVELLKGAVSDGRGLYSSPRASASALAFVRSLALSQGLTVVHFSAQLKSHLPVSPCLINWRKIVHPTYPTECAHDEPKSGRV